METVWGGEGRLSETGETEPHPRGVPAVSFETVLCFSYQISAMSAEATEREAPCPPTPRASGKNGWMNVQADIWEACGLPHCAAACNPLLRARRTDRRAEAERLMGDGYNMRAFLTAMFAHTAARLLVSGANMFACVREWLSGPHKHSVRQHFKSCRRALPLKPERLSNSA